MARTVKCIKLGKEAEGLDFPPYPGELGKRIYLNVSKQAWADWLKHQTMLVNENRLNLADQRARQYLARQMENHFFGEGADVVVVVLGPASEVLTGELPIRPGLGKRRILGLAALDGILECSTEVLLVQQLGHVLCSRTDQGRAPPTDDGMYIVYVIG